MKLLNIWKAYTNKISLNCNSGAPEQNIEYWRNDLFAWTVIYLLPFSLIALLPGIYFSFLTGRYIIGFVDIFTATGIFIVGFWRPLSLRVRKILFVCLFAFLSCALLIYLGLSGPGLLYLLVTCLFSLLFVPARYSFWPAWAIALICLLYALCLVGYHVPGENTPPDTVGAWIAVSSNLVFLCFLLTALIPRLFRGLQKTLDAEKSLKETLSTQQRALQQALEQVRQKNDELEQFAYVASHDLREPLRMVTSFMGLLKDRYGSQLDDRANTYIDFAVDGSKRMEMMIRDLLELSRTGRNEAQKEMVPLAEIINQVQQNLTNTIVEHHAAIVVDASNPVLPVYRGDLIRLFQNLLSNAIKFRKDDADPVIRISCTEQEDRWLISVEDNGIGIKKEYSEKIFEIFSRLHTHDTYQGSGIGLAVCKKVAEQHGGTIWVHSTEGKGSTFFFTIQK